MFETQSLDAVGRISQGDCVDALAKLPAGVADLVFADPPFNIGYDYDIYNDKKARSEYLEWSRKWIGSVHRALKPDGTFWLAIGDEYAAELKILSQDVGFYCRSWVIWYYTFGVNCTRKFSRSHAHLFHFVKNPKNFTFRENELENRIPSARQLVYGDARANPHGRLPDDTWILRPQDIVDCFTPSEDSWYFPRVAGTFSERAGFHGCQMPEQLLGRIIRTCSNEDDLVLDPFSGSATTLVVAKKLGRRFMGFELSEDYTRRGTERLELCRPGDPLEGAKEPLLSAPNTPSATESKKRPKKVTAAPVPSAIKRESGIDWDQSLVEAFKRVHDGYSLDRVIADPELDARLEAECLALKLDGDIVTWNHALFGLRKKGRLSGIPTSRRTEFGWIECDNYLFAVEIALRQMRDKGTNSLDDILCSPVLASDFDMKARSLAPGYDSLRYRWGALKLRKAANSALKRALDEKLVSRGKARIVELLAHDFQDVPSTPGVYLVSGQNGKRNLYGGGTLNLQQRFNVQFSAETREIWRSEWKAARIRFVRYQDPDPMNLLGLQSRWIQRYDPELNYLGHSAA